MMKINRQQLVKKLKADITLPDYIKESLKTLIYAVSIPGIKYYLQPYNREKLSQFIIKTDEIHLDIEDMDLISDFFKPQGE